MTVHKRNGLRNIERFSVFSASGVFAILLTVSMGPAALADITNSAIATGANGADNTNSPQVTSNVPLVDLAPDLTISNTIITPPVRGAGAGDVITYHYVISNKGNQTLTNILPVGKIPTFDGNTGTGSLGNISVSAGSSTTLPPGASVAFTASYTLSLLDIYRAAGIGDGVHHLATASSAEHKDKDGSTALTTIEATPSLIIEKTAILNDEIVVDSLAQMDETITYTYTVTNTGNVALKSVGIKASHSGVLLDPVPAGEVIVREGVLRASDVGSENNGVIDQLEAGAIASFTYLHTVTQAEIDAQ